MLSQQNESLQRDISLKQERMVETVTAASIHSTFQEMMRGLIAVRKGKVRQLASNQVADIEEVRKKLRDARWKHLVHCRSGGGSGGKASFGEGTDSASAPSLHKAADNA